MSGQRPASYASDSVLAMRPRIRVLPRHCKKALHASLKKKGGGAPISASTGVRPAAERKACQRMRRAPSLSPANAAGSNGGALAFRRPTAVMRRGALPPTRSRAALPGITGSKREDPLRHQCSQHLAVRSRAGRSMPRTARICSVSLHLREPLPLRLGVPSRRRPSSSGILDSRHVTVLGTIVKARLRNKDIPIRPHRGSSKRRPRTETGPSPECVSGRRYGQNHPSGVPRNDATNVLSPLG